MSGGLTLRRRPPYKTSLPAMTTKSRMDVARTASTIAAGLFLLAAALVPPARGQDNKVDFYKGRNVTLVVGYSVGGGYDQYARALARHLGRHIPGNPGVLVQNMPGAASLTAVRYLDANAARDGTVIATFDPGLITESFASPDLFKVKFSDYQWIGTMLRDIRS